MKEKENLPESRIREQVSYILLSPPFKNSRILSQFLEYVVEQTIAGKEQEIKEYTIGINVLSRRTDFNPQFDAIVRTHAGRLRRALKEYYTDFGKEDQVRIEIPRGGYIPEFTLPDKFNESTESVAVATQNNNAPFSRTAVLPFKNLSGLPENDFIVDGFCEQLSSDLAQFPEIVIVAYYSTLRFRGEKQDIREVGKELNTSHLITGSIYRDKKHLRISMQLVSAVTGAQLWAQTYDRTLNSDYLYEVFDDIIKHVVPKLSGYHGLISRSTAFSTQLDPYINQDTIDAVFWYYHFQVILTEDVYQTSRKRIEKALQQNPNYAMAWAILAELYIDGVAYYYRSVSDPLQEANKCVQKALQLDADCQHAHLSMAWLFIFLRQKDRAVECLERHISVNDRSPFFLGGASFLFGLLGEYDKSMEYFKQSKNLNPYYFWWVNLGPIFTNVHNSNYNEVLEFANRIHIPGVLWNSVFRIAALGLLSRTSEAAVFAREFEIEFPGKSEGVSSILKAIIFDDLVYERLMEGLRRAGLQV